MKALMKVFIVLGLILLLAGLVIWRIPASWVVDQINLPNQDIQYSRVTGTIWQGGAEELTWHELMLGDVSWVFQNLNDWRQPATSWKVDGKGLDYNLSFLAEVEGDSLQRLRFVQGDIPAGWVDLSEIVPLLFLDGRLAVNLTYLELKRRGSGLAEGTIQWNKAAFKGLFEENLGTIGILVETVSDITHLYIQSHQVMNIMIEGDVSLRPGRYDVMVVLHTTEKKRYVIEKLAHLGKVRADGSLEIRLSGIMPR